jgi:hypothetical protein
MSFSDVQIVRLRLFWLSTSAVFGVVTIRPAPGKAFAEDA